MTNKELIAEAVAGALNEMWGGETHDGEPWHPEGSEVLTIAEAVLAAGLVVGEPTEGQIERAARVMWRERALGTTTPDYPWRGLAEEGRERLRDHAREVLSAAGVATQEPHIADAAVLKLRGLGLSDEQVVERLDQAVALEAAKASADAVIVACRISSSGRVTNEDIAALGKANIVNSTGECSVVIDGRGMREVHLPGCGHARMGGDGCRE